jgi:hypothetical protein
MKGFLKAYAKLTSDVQDRVDMRCDSLLRTLAIRDCTSKNTKRIVPCAWIRAAGGVAIRDLGESHYELLTLIATIALTGGIQTSTPIALRVVA